ncbi:MAG: hypothetical protein HZB39_13125 [Planctomycetes bacterium]|nr:hypothetical protein [Planctomycetota bacterium]
MPKPPYVPKPIDTTHVVLSQDLRALTERLAENSHEIWAEGRLAQGWRHGPSRDDAQKLHPDLVPYAELSDSEKDFDRRTALGSIEAILALGYRIEAPLGRRTPAPSGVADPGAIPRWIAAMETAREKASAKKERKADFDMDDGPELATLDARACPVTHAALTELNEVLLPVWREADRKALRNQKWHRRIAAVAISAGTAATVAAILQLVARHMSGEGASSAKWLGVVELVTVILAALAIGVGLWFGTHHGWLSHRQAAERLRSLKFAAVVRPEFWNDMAGWKSWLAGEVAQLRSLTEEEAHQWVGDEHVEPQSPEPPCCVASPNDLAACAALYRVKRLEFQREYFRHQASLQRRRSWIVERKVGLWLFGAIFVVVFLHGIHALHPPYEVYAIALAAILPVIGFGLRAWVAAFEVARSRALFQSKAGAVEDFVERHTHAAVTLEHLVRDIARGESFFANEHREWYRLQREAEWTS